MPLTWIGNVDMETTDVQTFPLPTSIPATATEVLIYAYIKAGVSEIVSPEVRYYTQLGAYTFDMYLHISGWPQDANTVTCDNMWLPLTPEWTLHVQLSEKIVGGLIGPIRVIGYR